VKEKELAKIFRALSEETRLKLIRLLSSGEKCVCKLFQALDLPQPKVSRHLAYLRNVGLVKNRKDGLWQHYSLNTKLIKEAKLNNIIKISKTKAKPNKKGCA